MMWSRRLRGWAVLSVLAVLVSFVGLTAPAATAADGDPTISYSLDPKRGSPAPLDGATLGGTIYPFLTGDAGVTSATWWLDDPEMAGEPTRVDITSPFDFSPGSVTHASAPFDTASVPDGVHVITAKLEIAGEVVMRTATFTTDNGVAALLTTSTQNLVLSSTEGGSPARGTVDVDTTDGVARTLTATSSQAWLSVAPVSGTTPTQLTVQADASLAAGTHTAEVVLDSPGLPSVTVGVTVTVEPAPIEGFTVFHSVNAKRTDGQPLQGAVVQGDIYPFLEPDVGVSTTSWWLDDPAMGGVPVRTDSVAPYDFGPGSVRHRAQPLDTTALADGEHTITVLVTLADGSQGTYTVAFDTDNGSNVLAWAPESLAIESVDGATPETRTVDLSATEAGTAVTLTSDAPWLTAAGTVTAPTGVTITADPAGLSGGTHTAHLTATSNGAVSAVLTVSLVVDAAPGLVVAPGQLTLDAVAGGAPVTASLTVTASDGSAVPIDVSADQPWLGVDPDTGATPAQITVTADPAALATGSHDASVRVTSAGLPAVTVPVSVTVRDASTAQYDVVYSLNSKRTDPAPLQGTTISGQIYPFLSPDSGVSSTSWWLDDPEMTGAAVRTDSTVPYDFAPGSVTHASAALDTRTLSDGAHSITAKVLATDGTEHVRSVVFTTDNNTNTILWDPSSLTVAASEGGTPELRTVQVTATTPGTIVTLASNAPWLRVPVTQVTTPASVEVTVDPNGLTAGSWNAQLVATAEGAFSATLGTNLVVGDTGGCAPVACELIKVDTPYNLGFRYDSGNIIDTRGVGTGFTTLLPRPDGTEYRRGGLAVDLAEGTLNITGTPGSVKENTLDNALGVGFDGPSAITVVSATVAGPPATSGKYEQAGVWFGYDQDHVDRVALVSTSSGWRVEHVLEVDGTEVSRRNSPYLVIPSDVPVELSIKVDPHTRTATGYYKVGDSGTAPLRTFDIPGEFFSFDGAGIDPLIGTRSFGGLFASQRAAVDAPVFRFSGFSVTGERDVANNPDFPFTRASAAVPYPTAMDFGPDGKLYVQSMFGKIYILSFGPDGEVTSTEQVSTLGTRLALGLTVDPESTPENVIVWSAHSSPSTDNGEADSGIVSRLSGPGLSTRIDAITGLPRSIANHGTNSIHFGEDGRLYIAQGGNTGAGAPNTANTEFGDRAEQKLSAALLVADVKTTGFDGTCAHPTDIYLSGDCDVEVFASGLRNTYDFVAHSNGHIYGPDNGLGVVGSFPPVSTPPCTGFGDTRSWTVGGNNPGGQNDGLNLIEQGGYYGHPNPARGECVFKDGHYQAVQPLPSYQPPIHDLGPNRSANGIIEYVGDAFCDTLQNNLLIGNYSVGDDITAVQLSTDGRSVVSARSIIGGFKDPLPLVQAPDGRIVVGEFGSGQVTFLTPQDNGCWSDESPLPVAVLDAGGIAIGDAMYVVGGKGSSGHSKQAYRYDTVGGTWSRVADLPGTAVENPAVTAANGKLYLFGGSTAAFSGAVAETWTYDPATNAWTRLPDMPTARGGATAQVLGGSVYVAGGMTADGASTAVVERFDLATGTWHPGPTMATARDNPGSAVVDGRLYVFGGRTRLAGGQTPAPTLGSVEMFDPATGAWSSRSSMPTARRTMATGVIDGRVILAGGEAAADGGPFAVVEQYDPATDTWASLRRMPTGRHGAAAAVVDGRLHVVAGGPEAGLSTSAVHEVLTP